MKKIISLLAILSCFFIASCGNDDETEEPTFAANELTQTMWDVDYSYIGSDRTFTCRGVVTFIYDNKGTLVDDHNPEELYEFDYVVNGRQIRFSSSLLVGSWLLTEKSKNRMVLRAYHPGESKVVLTRKY